MVHLDHGLICLAQSLITRRNIHRATAAILLYEQAVQLHNEGSAGHVLYQEEYEEKLRQFTEAETQKTVLSINAWTDDVNLNERNQAILEYARSVVENAQLVEDRCKELDGRVDRALAQGRGFMVESSSGKQILRRRKKRGRSESQTNKIL